VYACAKYSTSLFHEKQSMIEGQNEKLLDKFLHGGKWCTPDYLRKLSNNKRHTCRL